MSPDDVVIICDAYDVFAARHSSFILSKFQSLNVDVVAGAEHCTGENMADLSGWYLYNEREVHPQLPHLNAGFVMGKVFRLIEMYQFISEREDDQIAMGEYFCTRPWRLAVDFDRQFVYNHQYKLVEDPNNAYFIHFPGYKYIPETTVAYTERLKEMLAEEVGDFVKEKLASQESASDSDSCEFSLQNHTITAQGKASPGVCPLDSICNLDGSATQLDTLAEASQMALSLDTMARGSATMPIGLEPAVLPTAHHERPALDEKVSEKSVVGVDESVKIAPWNPTNAKGPSTKVTKV
eukprot:EG_transcript_15867